MLLTSSMMTTLVVISMMQPLYHHSILVPVLLGKVLALKFALFVAPKIAIGSVLFGQGAAVIGGQLLWRYLEWRRHHHHHRCRRGRHGRHCRSGWSAPVVKYAGGWGAPSFRYAGGWNAPSVKYAGGWGASGGWGAKASWNPLLHQKFDAAYHKGHRAIDYLALGLDFAQDHLSWKAAKALNVASGLLESKAHGWGWPGLGHNAHGSPGWGHSSSVFHGPVKTVSIEHGPPAHISHGPPGHVDIEHVESGPPVHIEETGPVVVEEGPPESSFSDAVGGSHLYSPGSEEESYISDAGPHGGGEKYYSSAAEAGHVSVGNHGDGTSGYITNPPVETSGPYYSASSYGDGDSPKESSGGPYYSSAEEAGHVNVGYSKETSPDYGGEDSFKGSRQYYSSLPSYGNGDSSKESSGHSYGNHPQSSELYEKAEPLDRDEFLKIMDWASSGGSSEFDPKKDYQTLSRRSITEAIDPKEADQSISKRIKRKSETNLSNKGKPEEKDELIDFLVQDVRRFFTIISYLDENKCLQKLVCDVHTKAKMWPLTKSTPVVSSSVSSYEKHIIGAFRILDTFMPPYETDSSTNYRIAAKLGLNSPTQDFCSYYYESCKYSANEIIGFNTKVESNQIDKLKEDMEKQSTNVKDAIIKTPETQKIEKKTESSLVPENMPKV